MSRSAYGWMNNSGFAKEHPRAWPQHDRKGTVHYDLYPPDALIRRLYEWPALTKFIGTVLGEERFYICDDPVMSAVLSVMKGEVPRGLVNRAVADDPRWQRKLAGYKARFG